MPGGGSDSSLSYEQSPEAARLFGQNAMSPKLILVHIIDCKALNGNP